MTSAILKRQPNDRTKREHIARLARVKFSNPTDQFVILELHDGRIARGTADVDSLAIGDTLRFLGRWEYDAKWGDYFRFEAFVKHEPQSRATTIRYLTKLVDGIGESRASKLYDRYGQDTCKVLRTAPAQVIADGLLKPDVAKEASEVLIDNERFESTKIELFGLFAGRGFPGTLIEACIEQFGVKAPAIIRRNPFALLVAELPGCGFKRTDRMWIEFGKPADALKRQMLCGWNLLRTDPAGNTWTPIYQLEGIIRETIPGVLRVSPAVRLGIRAGWFAYKRDKDGKLWIAESEKARNERLVATSVQRLLK